MYHLICVNYDYDAKIEAGDGTGAWPKWRLRLQLNTPVPGGSGSETLLLSWPNYETAIDKIKNPKFFLIIFYWQFA